MLCDLRATYFPSTHLYICLPRQVELRCADVGIGKPQPRGGYSWSTIAKTKCRYEWEWDSIYACPICIADDFVSARGVCAPSGDGGSYRQVVKQVMGELPCQGQFSTAFPKTAEQIKTEICVPVLASDLPPRGKAFLFGETNISIPAAAIAQCQSWGERSNPGMCREIDLFATRLSMLSSVMIDSAAQVELTNVTVTSRQVCPICSTLTFGDDDNGGDDDGSDGVDDGYYSYDDTWDWDDETWYSGSSGSGTAWPQQNCTCITYAIATIAFRAEVGNSVNVTQQRRRIDDALDGRGLLGMRTKTVSAGASTPGDGGSVDNGGRDDDGTSENDDGSSSTGMGGGGGTGQGTGGGMGTGGNSKHRWLWRSDFERTPLQTPPTEWITREEREPMIVVESNDPFRGRVLKATDCSWGGNAFSAATFSCTESLSFKKP